jgi:hypothetical protein
MVLKKHRSASPAGSHSSASSQVSDGSPIKDTLAAIFELIAEHLQNAIFRRTPTSSQRERYGQALREFQAKVHGYSDWCDDLDSETCESS